MRFCLFIGRHICYFIGKPYSFNDAATLHEYLGLGYQQGAVYLAEYRVSRLRARDGRSFGMLNTVNEISFGRMAFRIGCRRKAGGANAVAVELFVRCGEP